MQNKQGEIESCRHEYHIKTVRLETRSVRGAGADESCRHTLCNHYVILSYYQYLNWTKVIISLDRTVSCVCVICRWAKVSPCFDAVLTCGIFVVSASKISWWSHRQHKMRKFSYSIKNQTLGVSVSTFHQIASIISLTFTNFFQFFRTTLSERSRSLRPMTTIAIFWKRKLRKINSNCIYGRFYTALLFSQFNRLYEIMAHSRCQLMQAIDFLKSYPCENGSVGNLRCWSCFCYYPIGWNASYPVNCFSVMMQYTWFHEKKLIGLYFRAWLCFRLRMFDACSITVIRFHFQANSWALFIAYNL